MKHATRLVPRFLGRRLWPVQRSYRGGHDRNRVSLLGNGGVVSHRSAAELYGLGHLTADQHEFTVPSRRQTHRPDVRIHVRPLHDDEWASQGGLLPTGPQRIAADLLRSREDPEAVAQVAADALRRGYASPGELAAALAPGAAAYGFRRGGGAGLLEWLLDLTGDLDTSTWTGRASLSVVPRARASVTDGDSPNCSV
jgi:hypothetical protein